MLFDSSTLSIDISSFVHVFIFSTSNLLSPDFTCPDLSEVHFWPFFQGRVPLRSYTTWWFDGGHSSMSPLHYACLYGDLGVAICLVGAGADLEQRTRGPDMTALHIAIEQVNVDLVRLLVEAGANVHSTLLHSFAHSLPQLRPLQLVSYWTKKVKKGKGNLFNFLYWERKEVRRRREWTRKR